MSIVKRVYIEAHCSTKTDVKANNNCHPYASFLVLLETYCTAN